MQAAISFPLRSRYVGAWAPDLRVLRRDTTWLLYWTLLHDPQLTCDTNAWRRQADVKERAFYRSRKFLYDSGLLTDGGQLIAIPSSRFLSRDMDSAQRRLQLHWGMYGPTSRKDRARQTGIDYNSKALNWTPYGDAPDVEYALDWIGRIAARGRQWARNRIRDAGTATVLAWQPIWHIFQRRLSKGTPWLVHSLRNRNLPHLRDVDHLPDWYFEPVQLPLFEDALPVQNLTIDCPKPDGRTVQNLTVDCPKPDGFTAPVNGRVNLPSVKEGEESPAGESSASGDVDFSRDYLRRLGMNERQIEFHIRRRNAR